MPVETDVVVVEHVRGDAVHQGGGFGTAPRARRNERGEGRTAASAQFAINQGNRRIARSRDQNAETVGDPGPRDITAFRRNPAQAEISDEAAKVLGERAHVRPIARRQMRAAGGVLRQNGRPAKRAGHARKPKARAAHLASRGGARHARAGGSDEFVTRRT
jgi:hypothetical protein